MMQQRKSVFITRTLPQEVTTLLQEKGYEVTVSDKSRPLSQKELIKQLQKKPYDAVISLLTDKIDAAVMDAAPSVKIFANYAIGFNNFDIEAAKQRGVFLTNTPGGGAESVAEHTFALILALSCRIVEGDAYVRKGKYEGWDPMLLLGFDLVGKTLGILGTGRIGADVAKKARHGFGMNVVYYDVKRNEDLEREHQAVFRSTPEEVLKEADVISVHVPLLESTHHLINKARLAQMKRTAILVNTSRGPVIDEAALVEALQNNVIAGAGLDVFENEPKLTRGMTKLSNLVMTPHIASGTHEARHDMAMKAAGNVISVLETGKPKDSVYPIV